MGIFNQARASLGFLNRDAIISFESVGSKKQWNKTRSEKTKEKLPTTDTFLYLLVEKWGYLNRELKREY